MTDNDDFSFEDWLEKESQAMGEVFENMEAIPQEDIRLPEQPIEDAVPAAESAESMEEDEPDDGLGEEEPLQPQMTARFPEGADEPDGENDGSMPFEFSAAPMRPAQTARRAPADSTPRQAPPARTESPAQSVQSQRRSAPPRPAVEVSRDILEPPPGWGEDDEDDGPGFWDKWKYFLIGFTAVLMAAVVLLGVSFNSANKVAKMTTIYPNVTVNGVAVGGMTLDEAAQALGDPADRYDNATVTVNFPTGDSVTVTAQDLGLKAIDGTAYARLAYSYGRTGSLLANWKTYRACQDEPVELNLDAARENNVDEAAITALVAPVAEQVNAKLGTTQAEIGEEQITIVKRLGALEVDVPAVCTLIRMAFETETYDPIDYEMTEVTEDGDSLDVDAMFQSLYDEVYAEAKNAEYDPATQGATESVTGVRFDMDEAKRMWSEAELGATVIIPLIIEEPEITSEQLLANLFSDVLAEKSTSLSGSSSARVNNITLAAQAMNGTVLQPGQEFSYNACLGERTAAKGYQEAGAYSGGQHVTSIGGGICQGSSTLYYCALYANLNITTRECHYFTVGYLPRGLDATVSWGWPEFKFINSRSYPIKIEAYVSNGELTVRLRGTDVDGSYVEMTSETWEDSEYYYAQTYRKVYDKDGTLLSNNKEAYSAYHKYEANTPTPAPTATVAPAPQVPAAPPVTEPAPAAPAAPDPTAEPAPAPEPVPDPIPDGGGSAPPPSAG